MARRASIFVLSVGLALGLGCKTAGSTVVADEPGEDAGDEQAPTERVSVELPVPEDPSVSYAAWFAVGSQDDPPGKEGLAWLTGQLIESGGTTEHPWQKIVELLLPMAAEWHVRVDREMTTLAGRSHVDTADDFVALMTQQWTKPAFDPKDFERIRAQGLSTLEKQLRYASDEELAKAGFEWFVFRGTPYGHPPLGTVAGLSSLKVEDVRAFYEAHYTADRVVFAIGGDYQPDQLEALERSAQALRPTAAAPPTPPPEPEAIEGIHVLLIDKPDADATISFGHPISVLRGDPDFYALWLANSWLGEHRNSSSHLFQVIREARGLNYGDYSYIEAFPEGGYRQMPPPNVGRRAQLFQIWIRTLPNEHAVFALEAAHRELSRLVEEGLTQEQFELTREFLRKYSLHYAVTTMDRLGYAIDDRFYGLERGHLERFAAELDALTLDQVNAAIREHLDPANMKITIVTGEPDAIRAALESSEPVTIEYPSPKPPEVLAEDEEIGAHRVEVASFERVPVDEMFER